MTIKLCIGPMSKNVVDAALEFAEEKSCKELSFIPSRRQIEFDGGYVNNWTTEGFMHYVGRAIPVQRDHAGPLQGEKNYFRSLHSDIENGMYCLHVDPWKKYKKIEDAAIATVTIIEACLNKNKETLFEVGTEEQIRRYSPKEFKLFLNLLYKNLGENQFKSIIYGVVQSGTIVRATENTGKFDERRSKDMADICHSFGLKAKEHNSDYLTKEQFKNRADSGVDCFNIAPELGVLETKVVLSALSDDMKERFTTLCFESGKWEKWVDGPTDKDAISKICGHYQFGRDEFKPIYKSMPPEFNSTVKAKVKERISEILSCV